MQSDHELMGQALDEAEAALRANEVPVGCVFAHPDHGVIGRGHNNTVASCNGTRHAELEAIDQMLLRDRQPLEVVAACTLFVTVEPCIMCASALRQLGIRQVVFGCGNDKFGGCGKCACRMSDERCSMHLASSSRSFCACSL
jgi:tRNA-specific adenosine deaminase 2